MPINGVNRRELLKGGSAILASALSMANASGSRVVFDGASRRWTHPGIFQRSSDLSFMKEQILAAREPWSSAWRRMLALPTSSLDFVPKPVVHVVRGSYGAGQKGDREINESLAAAESHLLQWVVSGREEHAKKSAEILDAWASTLADFSGNDAMLLGGWTGGTWANIGEVLRAAWPRWSRDAQRRFEHLLRAVYVPLIAPFFPEANGNWDAAMMHSLLAIAVFCEDAGLLDRVLQHYRYGGGSSGITRYIYPTGQCEESTRDQAHTQLGLGYFAKTALIAWNQGIDLFAEADDRLSLGYEYTARYMLGEEVFAYGTISEQVRGRFDDCYEIALQHFRYDRKMMMPFLEKAAVRARPNSRSVLTAFRGDELSATLISGPVSSGVAFRAGARLESEPASSDALVPGQSLSEAMRLASPGTTIHLGPGIHILSEPLALRSKVTITGVGRSTILFLDASKTGPALIAGDVRLHDVTVRNLLIEASPLPAPSRDPNQDRRPLATQLALSRGGIALIADLERMRNLRFEHITIRNATLSAIEIFGADGVILESCDLSASGGAVAPGASKNHCFKLNQVNNVVVRGSRLVDSFHGCGIAIASGRQILIEDCELGRNALSGARVTKCKDVNIRECLAEGNGRQGVEQEVLMFPNERVALEANTFRNNGAVSRPE